MCFKCRNHKSYYYHNKIQKPQQRKQCNEFVKISFESD